jgi:endonuclease/exonuclease/phosphatase family metal-dependent hydrolase
MNKIRVMSFNIAGSFDDDEGVNAWNSKRATLNVKTIKRYVPDLIGFQELQSGNLQTYHDELPEYYYLLGPETDEEDLYSYNAIFWRPSYFELIDAGGFYLSKTPDRWSSDWDSACVRAANWVKLRWTRAGIEFLYLNTHLDHISELARVEGSKVILQHIAQLGGGELPVIVTGDFNCNPWVPDYEAIVETTYTDVCYHLFCESEFVDTYIIAGNRDSDHSNTHHGYEGREYLATRHHMAWRLDWILTLDGVQHLQTKSCIIVRDEEPPVYASDHYPVLADLTFVS